MAKFPTDTDSRRTDSRACAIVHYTIDSNHWVYRQITGQDIGCDCELELSENDSWLGHKIEAQIKGTRHIGRYILADGSTISFPLEVKTINYGLSRPCPFLLIVVDVEMGKAYFLELQEYFIAHPNLFAKTEKEDGTINLHIDCSNVISEDDSGLQEIARRSYIGGATPELRLAR